MKKIILLICLIAPLFTYSQNWQTNNIDINTIKNATIKLTERKYLLKELEIKDSIIIDKDEYINIQNKEINNYKYLLKTSYSENENLTKSIESVKKRNKIIYYVGGAAVIGVIVGLICK